MGALVLQIYKADRVFVYICFFGTSRQLFLVGCRFKKSVPRFISLPFKAEYLPSPQSEVQF